MCILKYLLFCCVICISCSHASLHQKQLMHALDFSAANSKELEKVLKHYEHDSLKLEAAKFLIRNMPHCYSYQQGGEMDKQTRLMPDVGGIIPIVIFLKYMMPLSLIHILGSGNVTCSTGEKVEYVLRPFSLDQSMRCLCLLLCVLALFSSCKESEKDKIARLVEEWEGKEILFPARSVFTIQGKDTVNFSFVDADYKVCLLYTSA